MGLAPDGYRLCLALALSLVACIYRRPVTSLS
jgi:hypothetical protein